MKKIIYSLVIAASVSGCVAKYDYQSQSPEDPTLSLGGHFEENPAGHIAINLNPKGNNKCDDYQNGGMVGTFSDDNKVFTLPKDKIVNFVLMAGSSGNCQLGPYEFETSASTNYVLDVQVEGGYCFVKLAENDFQSSNNFIELTKVGYCE
ncbi:hypothetical protein [Vibrio genomosp. F10]|uniref:hypothetical protein n=1 Tax=Vibrio genomosp. F10 TaxID=723171 RepID=UPI0002F54ED8|nr:hypothetical protein [Vibrio genomosp. F10]OEE96141.1 hypothetical protein A1QK_14455 [Vibrio genomosp. F10 str. 9ZD137]